MKDSFRLVVQEGIAAGKVFELKEDVVTIGRDLVNDIVSVSYTHLRAHETVLDLVCRLLLEKKTTVQHALALTCARRSRTPTVLHIRSYLTMSTTLPPPQHTLYIHY